MWAKYKRQFSNKFYKSLEDVENFITDAVKNTTKNEVMSMGVWLCVLDEI
ncbi:hypothetical protein [Flavobacterium sp. HJJ]|nr:hypothetical protein [Flavobacterium sp. HJJ]MBF4472764.1 hypothetical protein [Flavobacterium sp. HJJ]